MKAWRRMLMVFFLGCALTAAAQKTHELGEVVVNARRPLKDIGVQETRFDSLMLKENISLSMAEVLAFNSSVFVKNSGKATLSTVAFRGTSPSHTQVMWNGMRVNSPMLGMTDFSTIPAYFIDSASLLHGTSSVNETGGGLGGLVRLSTLPDAPEGWALQYVQGVGSFSTFDEFLKVSFSSRNWTAVTRAVCMSSPNDYKYVNHDRKENIYDDDHNIIGQYHPVERNRSGAYRDIHVLQEVFYNTLRGDRLGVSLWYVDSNRELPMLTTDYGDERDFENRQREQTFRGVASWSHARGDWKTTVRGGYTHTWLAYDYRREVTDGNWSAMTRSRSRVNSFFARGDWDYGIGRIWLFSASLSAHQHLVKSHDRNIILQDGNKGVVGYDKGRVEVSATVSAKWQPLEQLGVSLVAREDMFGDRWAPLIPALFVDATPLRSGKLILKASASRNYRFPSLNDLYFLPGGNPKLKSERGFSYDAGVTWLEGKPGLFSFEGSATWFDSYIDHWIMWLPTTKGFFSPRNVKKVHAYGVELKASLGVQPAGGWLVDLNGSYSWTPSVNVGEKMSPADMSVGRQLPYVPRHSASVTGRLTWRSWSFLYKWCWYSERFTMSSNDYTVSGHLPPYFMSNVSLERNFEFRPLGLQLKLAVNNLFNEDYLSVLSRPMPGINFEFFVSIVPHF